MIYNKNHYTKNDKKLLHKIHGQWATVSIALLTLIGAGGLLTHHAHADSSVNDSNIVTSWTPKVSNIQNQKVQPQSANNQPTGAAPHTHLSTMNMSKMTNATNKNSLNTTNGVNTSTNNTDQPKSKNNTDTDRNQLGRQRQIPEYVHNIEVNTVDKKTNGLISSQIIRALVKNNIPLLSFKGLLNREAENFGFSIPSGTNESISLSLNNSQNETDPNTGFTKQPINTRDVALPGAGWHVYVPYVNTYPNGEPVNEMPAVITGDFSNYQPLYHIGKLIFALQDMGINTKDIFPNSNDQEITGLFGNRLPANLKALVDMKTRNAVQYCIKQFQILPQSKQQLLNNELKDPLKYVPKTGPNAPAPDRYLQGTVVADQRAVEDQNYVNSMFPDIANFENQFNDMAVKIKVGQVYTQTYVTMFMNYVQNMAKNITQVYLGNTTNLKSTQAMFADMPNLKSIQQIGDFDTSQVTNMSDMFRNCYGLNNIQGLSGFNTSRVQEMQNMFKSDKLISNLAPLQNWNTHDLINASSMFDHGRLTNLDPLKNWDTSNLTNMGQMFANQSSLKDISAISNWKLSPYASGFVGMFGNDFNIVNHPNWDPNKGKLINSVWDYNKLEPNPNYGNPAYPYAKRFITTSYPMNEEKSWFNAFLKGIAKPFRKYFVLSPTMSPLTPHAVQLTDPNRKQDTDTVNFIYKGQQVGTQTLTGLDKSNLQAEAPSGYMILPGGHFFFNNTTHNIYVSKPTDPVNNWFTLTVPVNSNEETDLEPIQPNKQSSSNQNQPSNNDPSNQGQPDDQPSNNTPNNPSQGGTDGPSNTGSSFEGNGGSNGNTNRSTQGGNGNNNNNNQRHNGSSGSDNNNNPSSNNISGGDSTVNNNDHEMIEQIAHNNQNGFAAALALLMNEFSNEGQNNADNLVVMEDNDKNAALARQQQQFEFNEKSEINEENQLTQQAGLIRLQEIQDQDQNKINSLIANAKINELKASLD